MHNHATDRFNETKALINYLPNAGQQGAPSKYEVMGQIGVNLRRLLAANKEREAESLVVQLGKFLSENTDYRDPVVLGCLEHVLSDPGMRELFKSWQEDPWLAECVREGEELSRGFDDI